MPEDDWMTAVENTPNKTDKKLEDFIFPIIVYIILLLIILLNPMLRTFSPSNIKPIYIIRIRYLLCFFKIKYNNIPIININIYKLSTFIATINVVKQVPRLAPIIIPKHSFGFI